MVNKPFLVDAINFFFGIANNYKTIILLNRIYLMEKWRWYVRILCPTGLVGKIVIKPFILWLSGIKIVEYWAFNFGLNSFIDKT